jgi:ABC-2 type transport system permease protein
VSRGAPGAGRVQLLAVIRKEFRQNLRDRRIMFMLVAAPLIQTILFGFAVDMDVDRVPTVVSDADRSPRSREQLRRLLADGTLVRVADAAAAAEAERMMEQGRAAAAVFVPAGFSADLEAGRPATVQVVVDGTDPNRSTVAAAAASRWFGEEGERRARERIVRSGAPAPARIEVTPRIFYNPGLDTPPFIVPGIMALLLVIVTTIVTAMGLSRERETGTLEQVLVTPIAPSYLLMGKMAPFVAVGCFDVLLVLTAGAWVFGVPLRGSLPVFAVGSLLYLVCTLAVGLLISTLSATQQQSFLGGFLFTLPAVLLSGIITPVRSMPEWLQAVTLLNPLRYYQELVRVILMKGATLGDVAVQLAALAAFGAAVLTLATLRFRRTLA